jgi:RNA polymerase sigma factor (TIGR02999 family)
MSEITRILSAVEQGDAHAADQLLPLVYNELRALAAQKLSQENAGQAIEPTSLVHAAYVRLVDVDQAQPWTGKGHFFAAAAEAMRRILVDQARRRNAVKRGGGTQRHDLNEATIAAPESAEDVLAVNDALELLAAVDAQAAKLVSLRFFGGLNMTEAAEALGMSVRTAHQVWAYARAWLRDKMRPS